MPVFEVAAVDEKQHVGITFSNTEDENDPQVDATSLREEMSSGPSQFTSTRIRQKGRTATFKVGVPHSARGALPPHLVDRLPHVTRGRFALQAGNRVSHDKKGEGVVAEIQPDGTAAWQRGAQRRQHPLIAVA